MSSKINDILIPNVTSLKKGNKTAENKSVPGQQSEFKALFEKDLQRTQANDGVSVSMHAAKRLNERGMILDKAEIVKLNDAIGKLREKGGRESLVVTPNGAYIVDVKNSKVVTAIDKDSLKENVFTKIDSTLIMN
jgi:flagellar operon protein